MLSKVESCIISSGSKMASSRSSGDSIILVSIGEYTGNIVTLRY